MSKEYKRTYNYIRKQTRLFTHQNKKRVILVYSLGKSILRVFHKEYRYPTGLFYFMKASNHTNI